MKTRRRTGENTPTRTGRVFMPFGGPPRPIGTSLEDAAKNRRNTQPAPAERAWEPFKGAAEWREVRLQQALPVEKTAVIICDMWDKH